MSNFADKQRINPILTPEMMRCIVGTANTVYEANLSLTAREIDAIRTGMIEILNQAIYELERNTLDALSPKFLGSQATPIKDNSKRHHEQAQALKSRMEAVLKDRPNLLREVENLAPERLSRLAGAIESTFDRLEQQARTPAKSTGYNVG